MAVEVLELQGSVGRFVDMLVEAGVAKRKLLQEVFVSAGSERQGEDRRLSRTGVELAYLASK